MNEHNQPRRETPGPKIPPQGGSGTAPAMTAEAIREEREACAALVEEHPLWYSRVDRGKLADAIRNRA